MSQIKKMIDLCSITFKKHNIVAAYLFGSRANGVHTASSDYDVGIILNRSLSPRERFKCRLALISDLERQLKKNVDVIVLNDTSSILLKFLIINNGLPIYNGNQSFAAQFELKTISEYFDFLPFLEKYNEEYVKGFN